LQYPSIIISPKQTLEKSLTAAIFGQQRALALIAIPCGSNFGNYLCEACAFLAEISVGDHGRASCSFNKRNSTQ
jgi:hypothetical protein